MLGHFDQNHVRGLLPVVIAVARTVDTLREQARSCYEILTGIMCGA